MFGYENKYKEAVMLWSSLLASQFLAFLGACDLSMDGLIDWSFSSWPLTGSPSPISVRPTSFQA